MKPVKQRHPERTKLSTAVAEELEKIKARKGRIDKRATYFHTAEAPSGGTGGVDTMESFRPSPEQLARVNQFTRSKKSADEIAVFSTLSCNDLEDRDEDQFTTQCVKDFAELPDPFSPVGKSYMLDHAYSIQNAVGRIFGVDTKKDSGVTFLTNEVYVPNTEKNQGFLEDIDFGINWAVSVGVVLGKDECSLSWCDAGFSSWGWWCMNGHDKGMWYVKDAEEDSWGYPLPCDSRTKGAEKCIRLFEDPKDFYELSQVFLGAQYHAQLQQNDPEFAGILKAASAGGKVPLIGLKAAEAKKLPSLRHVPEKLAEAHARYQIKENDDGSVTWADDDRLLWVFDPEDPEAGVQCLGRAKQADDDSEEEEDGKEQLDEHDSGDGDSSVESDGESVEQGGEDGSGQEGDPEAGGVEPLGGDEGSSGELNAGASEDEDEDSESDSDGEEDEEEDSDSEDEEEVETEGLTAQAVLSAAIEAELPSEIMASLSKAKGHGLSALLASCSSTIKTLQKENKKLSGRAEMGERLLREARSDAIEWYVKSNMPNEGGRVSTTEFEALLDRCGSDVDLIRSLGEREKRAAQAKFGRKTTRSSIPKDPNERPEPAEAEDGSPWADESQKRSDQTVNRIHG